MNTSTRCGAFSAAASPEDMTAASYPAAAGAESRLEEGVVEEEVEEEVDAVAAVS